MGRDGTVVFAHAQLRIFCVERRSLGKLDIVGGRAAQEPNLLCLARSQQVGVSERGQFL